jgi:Domain of unknown function (DUF4260)
MRAAGRNRWLRAGSARKLVDLCDVLPRAGFGLAGLRGEGHRAMAAPLYNTVHCCVLPIMPAFAGWGLGSRMTETAALIWIAHIAFDRLLGFGLKYLEAFKPTHRQRAALWNR